MVRIIHPDSDARNDIRIEIFRKLGMDLPNAVVDDALVPIARPDRAARLRSAAPTPWVGNDNLVRIRIIDQVIGDDRSGVAALEIEIIEGAGEIIACSGIGLEDQLVPLCLVPAEIEHGMPAVAAVIFVVPAKRIELRVPRLEDVPDDWIDVRERA